MFQHTPDTSIQTALSKLIKRYFANKPIRDQEVNTIAYSILRDITTDKDLFKAMKNDLVYSMHILSDATRTTEHHAYRNTMKKLLCSTLTKYWSQIQQNKDRNAQEAERMMLARQEMDAMTHKQQTQLKNTDCGTSGNALTVEDQAQIFTVVHHRTSDDATVDSKNGQNKCQTETTKKKKENA